MSYTCKLCGAPAAVSATGEITRSCGHDDTVVASMAAVARGVGGVREASGSANRVLQILRALGTALMRRA